MACTLVFRAQGCNPRRGDEFYAASQESGTCEHSSKHNTRCVGTLWSLQKWKVRVAKHDDQSKEHHHGNLELELKQELELKAEDHYSKHDKTVASLLAHLHGERIIAVRKEPNLHIVFFQREVSDGMRTPWNTHIEIREVVRTFSFSFNAVENG